MGLRSILECGFETRRGVQLASAEIDHLSGPRESGVWRRSRRNGETGSRASAQFPREHFGEVKSGVQRLPLHGDAAP
jgi:hypothetical protein